MKPEISVVTMKDFVDSIASLSSSNCLENRKSPVFIHAISITSLGGGGGGGVQL